MNASKWPRLRRWLKPLVFGLAVLATLVALVWAFENYRGKRLWQAYRTQLEAQGEVLDFRQLPPVPVPDDQNFFMTPLLRPFSDYVEDPATGRAQLRDTNACERTKALFAWTGYLRGVGNGWRLGRPVDLEAWQRDLRSQTNRPSTALTALHARPVGSPADDLAFLLAANQAELDEVRAATRRPAANLKARYEDGLELLLPQLAVVKPLAQVLRVAALTELARGDSAAAARDTLALFRIGAALDGEPLLIAGLVRVAILELGMQPLWEGLARHQWTDTQLASVEAELRNAKPTEHMLRCLRGERTFAISVVGSLPLSPEGASPGQRTGLATTFARLPAAMRYQNQVRIARLYQDTLLPALNPVAGTVDLERLDGRTIEAGFKRATPYNLFAKLLVPAIAAGATRAAEAQATVNLARVAIALERYRLANGAYPETLEAVTPQFLERLPVDPVTGQPLRYRRSGGDQFTLYALGSNRVDDGGAVAVNKSGAPAPRAKVGDWVWQTLPVTNTVSGFGSAE